jgi:hypothetical protein
MTEGMTAHAVQALVETGYASNEKAMDPAVARITRVLLYFSQGEIYSGFGFLH